MAEGKSTLLELESETKGPIEQIKQKIQLIKLELRVQGKLAKKVNAA